MDNDFLVRGDENISIREYLRAGLVDEMHVAVVPLLLGGGERLLDGEIPTGYDVVEYVPSAAVAHYRIARSPA